MSDSATQPAMDSESEAGTRGEFRQRVVVFLLLVGFGGLFLLNNWARDFWAPGEVDFAAACREMSARGNWFEPTIAGRPYFEKPILVYWLALFFGSTGMDDHVAYRLPGALFGVLGLWVTYYAGRMFVSRGVGILALVIQGTSYLYFRTSSWFLTDVVFASLVSLCILAFAIRILWSRYSTRWLVVGYLSLAFACLAKSPLLAPYFVGMVLLLFVFFQHGLRRIGTELGKLKIPLGLLGVLLVLAPWYVWMISRYGWTFLDDHFFEHHLQRLQEAQSHRQRGWYYFFTLPADFLPWSIFLPFVCFYVHSHFDRSAQKFFTIWALVVFISLSLVSSKYGKYLLPMWTPLALLLSCGLHEVERESIWEGFMNAAALRLLPWLLRLVAALLIVAGALWLSNALPGSLQEAPFVGLLEDSSFKSKALTLGTLLAVVLAVLSFYVARQVKQRKALGAVYLSAVGFALVFAVASFHYSDFNQVKSARPFVRSAEQLVGNRPLAVYGKARPVICVYMKKEFADIFGVLGTTGKNKEDETRLLEYLESPKEQFLLMYDKDRKKLEGDFPRFAHLYKPVHSGYIGSRRLYWVMSNRVR